jgi:two-component system cell cycle sensor histidine kinase/response regulator CckA
VKDVLKEELHSPVELRAEEALCLLNRDGRIVEGTPAFWKLLGLVPGDGESCRIDEIFDSGPAVDLPRIVGGVADGAYSVRVHSRNGGRAPLMIDLSAAQPGDQILCRAKPALMVPRERPADAVFRYIVESSLDVVSIVAPDGTLRYVSPASADVTGFLPEELVGGSAFEHIHPDDRPEVVGAFERALAGILGTGVVEYRFRHKDGSWRRLQSLARNLLSDPEVRGIVVSSRDVTERRAAEEALRASEERVRLAHDAARIGDWEFDLRSNSGASSAENLRIWGVEGDPRYSAPEEFFELVHPEDRGFYWKAFDDLRHGVSPPEYEYRIIRPDGRLAWLQTKMKLLRDESGQPARVVGVTIDITQHKNAEVRLRYSQDMFRRVFTNAPLGMALCDPATTRILKANESLARMFGYSPDQMTGRTSAELSHPEDAAREMELTEQMFRGEIPGYSIEKRQIRKDKSIFWSHLTVSCIRDEDSDEILVVLAMVEDITERKNLEEQLRQSQKMEAVGRLAGGVAHDFNNLLTVILGYANLLKDRPGLQASASGALEYIIDAGNRASILTRQLLAFSRRQVLSPELVNPNDQLARMADMIRRLIGEDIDLRLELAPAVPAIRIDPGQFGQIIINLAVNARDAMPNGGVLRFQTERVTTPEDHRFASRCQEYVRLRVIDNGVGMTGEVLQHVFEPFFTTKEPGKGTGLGLSTVYGIVQQSAGLIEVSSEPGKGSVFELSFPAEPLSSLGPDGEGRRRAAAISATVLLVEDEEGVRALAKDLLSSAGLQVVTAEGPAQAIEKFTPEIDLLVTDVVMPEMSGPALAARLREQHAGLKVVYISGYADHPALRDGSLEDGAVLVSKPFSAERLIEAVAGALRGREFESG